MNIYLKDDEVGLYMSKAIGDTLTNIIKDAPEFTKKIINKKKKKPKIGLALGGGAAWGICHIGVLQALEDNNIHIDFISGTSIGSLVGGLYSAGVSVDRLRYLALHAQWKSISQLSLPFRGVLSNQPMGDFINSEIGHITFNDLYIPFSAVATDLITGNEEILDKGEVSTAIRASCAVPGIFRPVIINNQTLVDGGVANNVPVSVVKDMGADIIIAVNTFPSLEHWEPKNSLQIILKTFLIMQSKMAELETALADVLISIDTKGHNPVDLNNAKNLYNKGLIAGLASIEKINKCLIK